jgi:hypothetical protein
MNSIGIEVSLGEGLIVVGALITCTGTHITASSQAQQHTDQKVTHNLGTHITASSQAQQHTDQKVKMLLLVARTRLSPWFLLGQACVYLLTSPLTARLHYPFVLHCAHRPIQNPSKNCLSSTKKWPPRYDFKHASSVNSET